MSTKTSPDYAPDYALYRENVGTNDVIGSVTRQQGCNAAMYHDVHVQVIPAAGVNPNVAIYWWSEKAGLFIQEHTPITFAGVGAGVPYEFTIQPKGRIFFVAVTATTGNVSIAVAGFEQERKS